MKKEEQIARGGPNVNQKFIRYLAKERTAEGPICCSLLEIGSCVLHAVHRAFQSAILSIPNAFI